MARDPIVRRRRLRLAVAVLIVGLMMSAALAMGLIYMAGLHPGS